MPPLRFLGLPLGAAAVLALALAWAPGAPGAPGAAEPAQHTQRPQRIVSLNLCADQYLVELADPGQIAGLTRNATNPEMSAVAGRVGNIHILSESAEEILAIEPDLVVGVPARRGGMLAALSGRNYRIVDLKSADSYAQIVAQVRAVAAAVGHPERGEALVARMDDALARLDRPGAGRVAAYYQRRGYLTGTGTLVDDLMTRTGLVNLAGKLGKSRLATMSLEELMDAQPDFMVVESATDQVVDQGTEMLHHPVLADIARVRLPQAWTVCGGPAYVDAATSLAMQVARH